MFLVVLAFWLKRGLEETHTEAQGGDFGASVEFEASVFHCCLL